MFTQTEGAGRYPSGQLKVEGTRESGRTNPQAAIPGFEQDLTK